MIVRIFAMLTIISLIMCIIVIISQWKIYKKAGKNGWECLVPVYNIIVLLEIVELPMWYLALFFVPMANIYALIKIYIELAHKFGKSTGFGILTYFFSIICFPILAFSKDCVYQRNNNDFNSRPNLESTPDFVNLINEEKSIEFHQNINTEINQINPLGFQPVTTQNDMSNQQINLQPNPMKNPLPEMNITPEIQNQLPESSQPIEFNQPIGQLNNEQQVINVIPNFPSNEPTINNENTNSLSQPPYQQSELNVIPSMQNSKVEYPQPIQPQNIENTQNQNMNQTQAMQSSNFVNNNNQQIMFNQQQTNNAQIQGINVIPTLGPTPTIQNPNNNQNM